MDAFPSATSALAFLVAYDRFKYRSEQLSNAFRDQGQILSLPMLAEITASQQSEVIELIRTFL